MADLAVAAGTGAGGWRRYAGTVAAELGTASRIEARKLRRSRVPLVTALAFALVAAVGALFMFIMQNPARARDWGLLGGKAELSVGRADTAGYFDLLGQAVSVGGLVVFGLVFIWIFGREFTNHTAKDLLALPMPRSSIVTGKIMVAGVWCMLLTIWMYLLGLVSIAALRLPGASTGSLGHALGRLLLTALLMVALVTPFGLVATIGRGYLAATGFMFLTIFVGQIGSALGYGQYFPWAVPALALGTGGSRVDRPGWIGYLLVVLVGVVSVWGTRTWWNRHDQAG